MLQEIRIWFAGNRRPESQIFNSQEPHIKFKVCRAGIGGFYGEIEVYVDSTLLMQASDYPLTILADQLIEWSDRVDDGPACESFLLQHPQLAGTFRIEPRPTNWQFTSWWETRRHERLLPLEDFKQMAERFHEQLRLLATNSAPNVP